MRTPRRTQSALRAPLNEILGTAANVRLLRVLALTRTAIGAGELASRTNLNRTSVYPALVALEGTGIIDYVGSGAQRQLRLRTAHPLAASLRALFRAEVRRIEDLIAALRKIAQSLQPIPTAVWIEGPVLTGTDRLGDPLVCYVLADPAALPALTDQLSEQVAQIERDADVTIEIRGTTRSELLSRPETTAAQLRDAILLAGIPPGALRPDTPRTITPKLRSHEEHDVRARRLAVAIAAKLKRDPELIRTAREHLDKRERTASTREQRALQEWARILSTMSPNRLQRFLIEPSERATRLRQSLPLLDVLSSTERDAVLASTTDAEVRAVVSGKHKRSPAT